MLICTHCMGHGYTSVSNGDDDQECTTCKGIGLVKETQLQRLVRWADFDPDDDQYRDGRNPDDREWMSRVQDTY